MVNLKIYFQLFALLFFISNQLLGVDLKPWEDWWEKNYKTRGHEFRAWWGNENAASRIKIREHIKKHNYTSMLDIGFGTPAEFNGLKHENINIKYEGIDVTAQLVDEAKQQGLNVRQANAEDLPFEANTFDLVYCRHLLEHLCDYEQVIEQATRVAKKEVAVVFFMKPTSAPESIDLKDYNDGTLLFHNRYNKEKLENFVLSNKDVKNIEWEDVNNEAILHIYLKDFSLEQITENKQIKDYIKKLGFKDLLKLKSFQEISNVTKSFDFIFIEDRNIENNFEKINSLSAKEIAIIFSNSVNRNYIEQLIFNNQRIKGFEWEILENGDLLLHLYLDLIVLPLNETQKVLNNIRGYLPENPVIVEAGAYDGADSRLMSQFWPNSTIYSFEPVPDIYKRLQANVKDYKNIFTYPFALSDTNEFKKFHLSEDPANPGVPTTSGSLYPAKEHLKYHFYKFDNAIVVPTIKLADWAKQAKVKAVDLLWLDMQGYELPMLKANEDILNNVKVIYIEAEFVEAYEGQPLYTELKEWLESKGFRAIARDELFGTGKLSWCCNLVFVKN